MVIVPTPPVYYFLTTFPTHPTYLNIRDICAMYRLPRPLVLLSGDLSKHAFKSMAKLHIRKYWKERLTDEVRNLKSLQFFEPRTCSVWRPHLLWEFSKSNPFESCKAMVVARMISGRYRTDMLQKHWTNNRNGYCQAPTCVNVLGDLIHMMVTCPSVSVIRSNMYNVWMKKSALCPPLATFLLNLWGNEPEVFMQFILEPSVFPKVASLCHTYGIKVYSDVLYLTRTYAFYLDKYNKELRADHLKIM